jgi:hypothetical protein
VPEWTAKERNIVIRITTQGPNILFFN